LQSLKKWLSPTRLKQISASISAGICALWLAVVTYAFIHAKLASSAYETELQSLRKDGLPVSAADIKHPYVPPDRNAASYYLKIAKLLSDRSLSPSE